MDKSAWNQVSKNNGQSSEPALGKVETENKRPGGSSATWKVQGGMVGSSSVLCSYTGRWRCHGMGHDTGASAGSPRRQELVVIKCECLVGTENQSH